MLKLGLNRGRRCWVWGRSGFKSYIEVLFNVGVWGEGLRKDFGDFGEGGGFVLSFYLFSLLFI